MNYWICEAKKAETLSKEVNEYIEQGWRPHGELVVVQSRSTSDWWFYQALVRDLDPIEELDDPTAR